ncbi:TonB-dependent receptor [Paremcibacter congregatus]|uniref:TonB-dependent receptor n=1 Tax=Paremcibacter congregatus TaxID=2043170 RepID=A0A2G4YW51_9PROT|nr:TonB-dependent receptor [Paremcibacter congregatus]PHZ86567.1 TonB-dependent receptor [Paremcibacter congregatus]QDE26372.1 TonB-dependent receptor [Paremcibacter congregatus]
MRNPSPRRSSTALGLIALLSLDPMAAMAAEADTTAMLEEITVTAQRRSENLQQVPVAVTALSANAIEKADIHTPDDIATRIPGMTFSPFAPGQSVVSLRGISSNDDGAGTENSVAVFLDDVYLGRISNMAFEMFDVERIEVLRGPQGTLYGKNAIGGAINVVSSKPSDTFQAKIKASVGNYNRKDFAGMVTGPLSDNLNAKVSFSSRERDGWVQNIFTGNKLKDENVQSVRGQLLWTGDATEVLISADAMNMDQADMARIPVRNNPGSTIVEYHKGLGGDYKHSTNPQDGYARKNATGVSLRVVHDFGDVGSLTSISAYRDSTNDWEMDSVGAFPNIVDEIDDKTKQYSQEFRFSGTLSDKADYVLGLFYLNENTDRMETFRLVNGADDRIPTLGATDPTDLVGAYRQDNTTDSFAAFAHAKYAFTEKLTLGLGLRYSYEKKNIDTWTSTFGVAPGFIISSDFGTDIIKGTGGVPASESWSDLSPKASLDYQANENTLIYASVSKGFKSGGFGAAPESAAAATTPLAPETAWNYEIGTKADLVDGTLRLNLAAFYTDYQNLQFQRFGTLLDGQITPFGVFRTRNAASAKIYGLEAEATWVPAENLYISGIYSYMHTEADFDFSPYYSIPPATADIRTKPLTRAPSHKFSINLDYSHPAPWGGELAYHIDYRYTGDQRGDVVSDATLQPAFGLSDASVSWTSPESQWEFSLWGKNIFDEKYVSHIYIVGPGDIAAFGDPRMYGAAVTWRFN